ncbi:MAG: phytanoyl-CoA dioxygenase family protein [Chloroflexi bacterium]|nr:phytanoyl-CoA dioxygenase family protein [Chloroflexota bacterium]
MFEWTYEELPQPTTDLATLQSNIDEFGYCLVKDAITPGQLAVAKQRLLEQAEAELTGGHAFEDGGAKQQWGAFTDEQGRVRREAFSAKAGGVNQRVWVLINKGKVWRDLLQQPTVRSVVGHVLGEDYLLSSYGANIAKPGGVAMNLHTDQWWMPEPIHRRPNPVPAGSLTRELSNRVDDHPAMIAPPVVVNVMWMLNDFTEEIGATRLVPRSHLYGRRPDAERDKDVVSIPAEGSAGSAMLFDGRIWHGTGANVSDIHRLGVLTTFVAPQFRTQVNFTMATAPEVVAEADDDLLALLGFKIWNAYGRVESPVAGYIQQGERSLGKMKPLP